MVDILLVVDSERNRLVQIKGENSHDGLGIDDITSGDEIEIRVEFGYVIYEILDFVNGIQTNGNSFHTGITPLLVIP